MFHSTNVPFDQCSFDESAFDESVFDESVVSLMNTRMELHDSPPERKGINYDTFLNPGATYAATVVTIG